MSDSRHIDNIVRVVNKRLVREGFYLTPLGVAVLREFVEFALPECPDILHSAQGFITDEILH